MATACAPTLQPHRAITSGDANAGGSSLPVCPTVLDLRASYLRESPSYLIARCRVICCGTSRNGTDRNRWRFRLNLRSECLRCEKQTTANKQAAPMKFIIFEHRHGQRAKVSMRVPTQDMADRQCRKLNAKHTGSRFYVLPTPTAKATQQRIAADIPAKTREHLISQLRVAGRGGPRLVNLVEIIDKLSSAGGPVESTRFELSVLMGVAEKTVMRAERDGERRLLIKVEKAGQKHIDDLPRRQSEGRDFEVIYRYEINWQLLSARTDF